MASLHLKNKMDGDLPDDNRLPNREAEQAGSSNPAHESSGSSQFRHPNKYRSLRAGLTRATFAGWSDPLRCSLAEITWGVLVKTYFVTLAAAIVICAATTANAAETVTLNAIDANGVGKEIGTLSLSDSDGGLRISPQLAGLPAGDHGFHVHVNPDCGPGAGPNGQPTAGMAAGGHFDPAHTGKHLGPHGDGHMGDLTVLTVDASGNAATAAVAPHLTLADVKGHSIMIHAGGDNYSDQPAPLGGGGVRIACGVVK
jgi:Cu-Zn family superoxide dismutase